MQYFHVVFAIPDSLASVALQNKKVVYNILFQAVSETLLTIAADPNHLGTRIGMLAVSHTSGSPIQTRFQLRHSPRTKNAEGRMMNAETKFA